MNTDKKTMSRIRSLCRRYPDLLTAHEVVGQTYLLLAEQPGHEQQANFLADHLGPKDLAKLIAAARAVCEAENSFVAVNGYKLGAVVFPAEAAFSTLALDDRLIPAEFVKQLMHCRPPARGRSV